MTRVFVDTNIIIDLLAKREEYFQWAEILFDLGYRREIAVAASALSFANAHFILKKSNSTAAVKSALIELRNICSAVDLTDHILSQALHDPSFNDFEDSLQYHSALSSNQEVIITRNLSDFKSSAIPVMTAEAFIKSLGY